MSGGGDSGEMDAGQEGVGGQENVNPPQEVPSGHVLRASEGATCASEECARQGHISCRNLEQVPAAGGNTPQQSGSVEVLMPPPEDKS